MTALTFIAFTLIKKANFRLDPDNVGMIVLVTIGAFLYNYFGGGLLKAADDQGFLNSLQTAMLS